MKRLVMGLLFSAAVLCSSTASALEIGIWPYMSTRALLTLYHPLQNYLERKLNEPVLFVTARNQRTFVDRTQRGEYRFVVTAPHFARLAEKEAGYVPMLRPRRDAVGIFIVERKSALSNLSDLRGKTVTLPAKITSVAIQSEWKLKGAGIMPGRDVYIRYAVSHNSAALDVLRGDSAAAATTATIFDQMPDRSKFRVLAEAGSTPPLIFLANAKVPKPERENLKRLLMEFAENTPEGERFIKKLGWRGVRAPTEREMRSLDPYVAELHQLFEEDR